MSAFEIVVVIAASGAGAIVHSCVGIGLGLVAGPALVAIDPDFVPGPLLLIGQLVNGRNAIAERQYLDRPGLVNCLWGLPVGLITGLLVLEAASNRLMSVLIGSLTAVAAAALLLGLGFHRGKIIERGAGAVTGFASITAGLPGPPLVLAFSDLPPRRLRATAGSVILITSAVALVSLAITGNFGRDEIELSALLVPGIVGGLVASRWVRPLVDRRWFRPTVLTVAMVGGIALAVPNIF